MKKSIILLIFSIFITTTIFSQEIVDAKKTEISSDVVDVVNTVFDKTTEAITQLASALKVPAEHVYTILIKQQLVQSLSSLLGSIFVILLGLFIVKFTYKDLNNKNTQWRLKNDRSDDYNHWNLDDGGWIFLVSLGFTISVVGIIILCASFNNIITGFINPEYGAIKDIMNFL